MLDEDPAATSEKQLKMARSFAINSLLSDDSLDEEPDIEGICKAIGFEYPRLVPHRSSSKVPFRPHQIAGMFTAHIPLSRTDTRLIDLEILHHMKS